MNDRRAGLLLPVASLPGPHGIGDLGPRARALIRWLADAGQRVWQILPLAVVDGHGCPYASPTAFAREPLYLSLDDLVDDGFLPSAPPPEPVGPVDWSTLRRTRTPILRAAASAIADRIDLAPFVAREPWVVDWAHFCALRDLHGPYWPDWPEHARDAPLREGWRDDRPWAAMAPHIALQWALERQWQRIRQLARAFDVELWGDVPFFVNLDSADVWAARHRFAVTPAGLPVAISGVPPDAFAVDGQMWGHPQFAHAVQEAEDWVWWRERVVVAHRSVDVLRLDHFRGLDAVWSIPAGATTAAEGEWVPGPGAAPLQQLLDSGARLVAEDLGVITPAVRALRDEAGLPGMAVLQFAFGPGGEEHFLPHRHRSHQVVYTGTHDNDTLVGWLTSASSSTRAHIARYTGCPDADAAALRALAWRSVADVCVLPVQDVLGLGAHARTNTPGTVDGNWCWRCPRGALDADLARSLREEAILSGRRRASP